MTIQSDYEAAAWELLSRTSARTLRPKLSNTGVAMDISNITIDFRVEGLEASGDQMQMMFWAVVGGVRRPVPARRARP